MNCRAPSWMKGSNSIRAAAITPSRLLVVYRKSLRGLRTDVRTAAVSIPLVRLRHQHRLIAPHIGECLLQVLNFRRVVEGDVGLVGMLDGVVLVIGLGREERRLHRAGLGDDRALVNLRRIELRDVVLRDLRLRLGLRDNLRAILRTGVGPLAVELRRVVRDREEDLQDLAVGNLLRVKRYLHGFGVAGAPRADGLVQGVLLRAAGITGHRILHALRVLIDRLDAPEASAREYRGLESIALRRRFRRRRRDGHGGFGPRRKRRGGEGKSEEGGSEHHGRHPDCIDLTHIRADCVAGTTQRYAPDTRARDEDVIGGLYYPAYDCTLSGWPCMFDLVQLIA